MDRLEKASRHRELLLEVGIRLVRDRSLSVCIAILPIHEQGPGGRFLVLCGHVHGVQGTSLVD